MKEGISEVRNIHYDAGFQKKRQVLPAIIRSELTEKQRRVIQEFYVNQRTTREVAAILGTTPSAALRLKHRAEDRIARCLRYLD